MTFMKGQDLYKKAKALIPGGTQLLTKRPEYYLPEGWPSYYAKAKGVEVEDLDQNTYIDMTRNGVGACILGAADPDVDAAVKSAIDAGSMSTLNCPEEVELAELLCELHPWAERVRYARTGGEAMAVAVRIARAATGKDVIACCGYHGWHDWYLAANLVSRDALTGHLRANLEPAGVPQALRGTIFPFRYNAIEELNAIVEREGERIGIIVMEPIRDHAPTDRFLEKVRAIADRIGAVLIFDEISAGFRLTTGGAHMTLGTQPDIAVFAKAMGNGYPMAAIIGRASAMAGAEKSFISSTYWSERTGPVAAIATIRKHRKYKVHEHLDRIGTLVQEGWKAAAKSAGLSITVGGIPPLSHFAIADDASKEAQRAFTRAMLTKGFLADTGFYPTFAHNESHVTRYLKAVEEVFSGLHP